MNPAAAYTVRHNAPASRFEVELEGQLCVADYRLRGSVLDLNHTVVPRALEGRGIAAAMVAAALAWAREQGWQVRPSCSYVATYMKRHPEVQDLLER